MNSVPGGIGEMIILIGCFVILKGVASVIYASPGKRYNEGPLTTVVTGLCVALIGAIAAGAGVGWLAAGIGVIAAVGGLHRVLKRREVRRFTPTVLAEMARKADIDEETAAFRRELAGL